MKTKNTKDFVPWTHWFLYGPTRSGKTEAASSFPKPLFIVPKNEQSQTSLMGRDIDYVLLTGPFGAFNEAKGEGGLLARRDKDGKMSGPGVLDMLEKEYLANPLKFPYQTIVIESMSHFGAMIEEDLTNGGAKQMDPQGWSKFGNIIRSLHMRLRNMEVHAVFTSLSQVKVHEKTGYTEGGPMMSGKVGGYLLPSACDAIGYCDRLGPKFRVHFKPFQHFQAGSRFQGMPAMVENFKWSDIEQFTLQSSVQPKSNVTTINSKTATSNKK